MTSKQYLLDTNILIDILNDSPRVMENLERVGIHQCCMSTISLHELYWGAQLAREKKEEYFAKEMNKISRLIEDIDVHPLSADGKDYAVIVADGLALFLRQTVELIDKTVNLGF